ncbi:hypothetical protein [Mesorhizobium sp.]|uniref:hypothetical protein n=1 Tax=Mesorhizobium sp. TaxID=1871066 RepID=UPI00338EA563
MDTHLAIDAILDLRNSHEIQAEQVKSVRCLVAPGVGGDLAYRAPKTPMEGKFSMEFCSAVALDLARGVYLLPNSCKRSSKTQLSDD